jgi:fluoroacetyl-CoA thioesterase
MTAGRNPDATFPDHQIVVHHRPVPIHMKDTLKAGLTHTFRFRVPETKTVPHLYPESEMFREMPAVLATGFMVGLMEWACIEALRPHLD